MATKPTNFIQHSEQTVQNSSFDEDFGVSVVENLAYDPNGTSSGIGGLLRAYPANALNLKPYDYVSMAISPATTETYTFKSGGSGGTTTNTVVIVYTDASRADISTVTKT